MAAQGWLAAGNEALEAGRWDDARRAFEAARAEQESADALFGLGVAAWWLGENREAVAHCTGAYAAFRRRGDIEGAVRCAVWLAITYKANFGDFAVANGWLARAERALSTGEPGALHGWVWIARAYRMADLDRALELSRRAGDVARDCGDVDLELAAMSQLGLIRVSRGDVAEGFGLLDEAIAAALAGEGSSLDTVVYACCDMLNACELASDIDRAAQWCGVADDFVTTYGCPFLYAECRIYYGSVLAARGRWADAERELAAGLRITTDVCPGLHDRALARLAALRVRQGRLEESERLIAQLGSGIETDRDVVLTSAALLLARGDGAAAARQLAPRMRQVERHRTHLAGALDLLVDARLTAGDTEAAAAAADRLEALSVAAASDWLQATAVGARGRVARARGDTVAASAALEEAIAAFARMELPYETARARFELALLSAASSSDLAVEHASRAMAGFEALGAAVDADRAAAFLRTLGVARPGPKRGGTLTAREQQVLDLLGAGLSNPEIASRLHVSRKTAAHHVSNILAKLNLRNRAEAAAFATAQPRRDATA